MDARVSVVIPTKNAGDGFPSLLARLGAQTGIGPVEIVVVDSGSTDATLAAAKRYACRVVRIRPSEFSHSHARNIGAAKASGDYILFMVQDALPAGSRWIAGLLRALLRGRRQGVAAASCREFPRMDSDLFADFLLHLHYERLEWGQKDRITRLETSDPFSLRKNGGLSNVACLIGKDVLRRHPLRGYYGEDLDLGVRLIKAGHKLALLSSVKVIHSHNRPPFYFLKRFFVDTLFLADMFGAARSHRTGGPGETLASIRSFLRVMDRVAAAVSAANPSEGTLRLCEKIRMDLTFELIDAKLGKGRTPGGWNLLDDGGLLSFLAGLEVAGARPARLEALIVRLLEQYGCLHRYVELVYPDLDRDILLSIAQALLKLSAQICGEALGSLYLASKTTGRPHPLIAGIRTSLAEGII